MENYSSGSDAEALRLEKEQLGALRGVLEDAVAQRGRYYHKILTYAVRFEADNTRADRDTEHFQHVLKMLGLPKARELVLASSDSTPGWSVSKMLGEGAKEVGDPEIRSLVLCHYAGHARPGPSNQLLFYASSLIPRTMTMTRSFSALYDPDEEAFQNTDAVLILDSCFSGLATRGTDDRNRSVEIIASVGLDQSAHGNSSDNARLQNKTFTSQLADEISRRIGNQEITSISFAEVIDELRRTGHPERLPQYRLQLGRVGVRIAIPTQAELPPHPRPAGQSGDSSQRHQRVVSSESSVGSIATVPPKVMAIFKVHLEGTNAESPEVLKLVQWLHSLNPNIGLQLNGVYMARSTAILFMAPWYLWAQLRERRGFSLVCETFGSNMLPAMLSRLSQHQHQQQSPRPTGPENIPPRARLPPPKPERPS